ncbi:MAG: hypothetical protein HN878_00900, partial [Candidatus Diapherotrites archaeon]|nr:hypothetical protein [Candidatus Diapherotrites archaeon]
MPKYGGPSDECLVEWTGPETGSFIENDNNPDPDNVNKWQVLDVPGDYNFTIRECPTGAPGSCTDVNDFSLITVNAIDPDTNPGSIWVSYRPRSAGPWAPSLRVSGYAPNGTTKVRIYVRDENNAGVVPPLSMQLADFNSETKYYTKNFGLLGVYNSNPQILNVQAQFVDANSESARVVVEALLADYQQSQIDQLEADVYDLNTEINNQDARITTLEQQVADLNAQDANFQQQITAINQRLADHDQNILDLQAEVDAVDQRVTDLNAEMQAEIANLQAQIDALDVRLTALEATVVAMNHGTINLFFDESAMTLRVYGEAPNGASDANIQIVTGTIVGLDGNNNYTGTIDVSAHNPQTYNVVVSFGGMTSIYDVSAIFNDLLVADMNQRLTDLELKVEKLDDGTIEFLYDSNKNKLTVGGEAPTTAACAMIDIYTTSGTALSTFNASAVQDPTDVDYSKKFSAGSWPKEALNVYVSFYTSGDCSTGFIQTGYDIFEGLLGEDLEGFRNIVASTYVTSFYVNEVNLPISYGLKVDNAGQYRIDYQLNGGTWTQLKAPSNFNEGKVKYQTASIDLTKLGVNKIKLRAVDDSNNVDYTSFQFKVRHADLKDKL